MANEFALALCKLLGIPDKDVTGIEVVCTPAGTHVQVEMYVRGENGRYLIDEGDLVMSRQSYELKSTDGEPCRQ